jgi:signal transduction histidine kinase
VIPLKESSRGLIVEVVSKLQSELPSITASWREKLRSFGMDQETLRVLERLTIGAGSKSIIDRDFSAYSENLNYNSVRLAKLQTDTRLVARSLELYQELCEPHLVRVFGEEGLSKAQAAVEMLRSATFVAFTGAYFDTRNNETKVLLRILDAELKAGKLQEMLDEMLQLTMGVFNADYGAVLLTSEDGKRLKMASSYGLEALETREFPLDTDDGFASSVAQSGEPLLVHDAETDPRISLPIIRKSLKSIWGVPLRAQTRLLGVLLIGFRRTYDWLPTERNLLHAIADRSVATMERVQMTDALREREKKIAELSGHLLRAQEEERKRISRELHDETGQALMVIRLYLGMLENSLPARTAKAKVRETLEVVDRTIEGIRRIISKLSPLVLQELGLSAAIRKEAKEVAKGTGIRVRVHVANENDRFAPEAETAVYRVVQEALHNVAKHAQAKTVNINLTRENDLVKLSVQDDGVGITIRPDARGHSFGLAGIKERVASLGGSVAVQTELGKGTRLDIVVPAWPLASELVESA